MYVCAAETKTLTLKSTFSTVKVDTLTEKGAAMYVIVQHTNSARWCIVSEFGHTVSSSLSFDAALRWMVFHYSQAEHRAIDALLKD